MSSNKTTTTTNQYAPGSLQQYQGYQGTLNPILTGYAQNPFGNPFYSLNLGTNTAQANQQAANMNQNALSQFNMTGFGGAPSGARTQLMSQLSRFGSGLRANAFLGAAQSAFSNQWGALNAMNQYQPLQTGQQQVQKTSGVGTWLPQLAGAAIGFGLGNPFAAFGAGGGGGGLGFSPMNPLYTAMATPGSIPASSGLNANSFAPSWGFAAQTPSAGLPTPGGAGSFGI